MYCEIHDEGIAARAGAKEIADLFGLYQKASTGTARPSIASIGADQLASYFDDLAILELVGDDFLYRHYGANVAAITGKDMTGCRVSQLDGEVADFFRTSYQRALADGQPLHTLHCTIDEDDSHLWERLVLPVVDADGKDLLVVFNRSQEAHFAADLADTPALATLSEGATDVFIDVPQVGLVQR